jgi:acyl-CoA thioesterase-1
VRRLRLTLALALVLLGARASAGEALAVLCFGDSITEGRTNVAAAECWCSLLPGLSGGRVTCINAGKGGRKSGAESEFTAAWRAHPEAQALIIALGTNDSRDEMAGDVQRVGAHVGALIAIARTGKPALPVLVVGPPDIDPAALKKRPADGGEQRRRNLVAISADLAALAKARDCWFVDLHAVVPPASLAADGVHPDAAGHRAIAAALWKELSARLPAGR